MKILAPATMALVLAGCAMDKRLEPVPPPPAACGVAQLQGLIGQPATPELVERVRRESGAAVARRITPEMRVTMEFRPDRVNVWVGLKGEVDRISCG